MKRETVFHLSMDEVEQAIVDFICSKYSAAYNKEMYVSQNREDGTAYATMENGKKK